MFLHSQEVITNFSFNPTVAEKYRQIKNSTQKKIPVALDTLSLPFLDDFSKDGIYPDTSLWLDSNVFINRDYPIAPPTLGVATFDGVSKTGLPYDTNIVNVGSYPADTLTSKPINLSLYQPIDSVFFSFFWQAQGRGDRPDISDSLLLQFKNASLPDSLAWKTVWFRKGFTATAPPDSLFHLVMLKVDTAFLKNGFQFRFTNWATISGNVDHWHIDYVFLDKNRGVNNTVFDDVAFAYNSKSLLKNYYAMPWEQYTQAEMKSNFSFCIHNLDTAIKNTSFVDTIFNECGYNGNSDNINPNITTGCAGNPQFANPPASNLPLYSFPNLTWDTSFLLQATLSTSTDIDRWNDTLRFTQNLKNYYAYDDGTVEGGYGINSSPAEIAYKFTLNKPDILYAVEMLFDWIPPNAHQQEFKVQVWDDSGGFPGNVIYQSSMESPHYYYTYHSDWGNLTNMFFPYMLKSPLSVSGTFYVGLIQYTFPSSTLLNLGIDKNTDSRTKMYFNLDDGNGWAQSQIITPCSWMIRPVLGSTKGLSVHEKEREETPILVFPNPSNGKFIIESEEKQSQVEIINLLGEIIYKAGINNQKSEIDLSSQPEGIYFLRATDEKGIVHAQKIILSK